MDVAMFLWTVVGVLISYVLPPLLRAAGVVPNKDDPTRSMESFTTKFRAIITSRAVAILALSLLLALVVTAVLGEQIDTWNMAAISGLGWQSILARTLAPGSESCVGRVRRLSKARLISLGTSKSVWASACYTHRDGEGKRFE